MALTTFQAELEAFAAMAQAAFAAAANADALEAARVEYLGAKSGRLKDVQKQLGGVAK
jgi:phenylalanyl-tRNA synthetase alpha chain